jgi:ribosomal-protein-alanine N-acetyltransferase
LRYEGIIELTTERLLLREARDEDADSIFSLRGDVVVAEYLDRPSLNSVDEAFAFIDKLVKGISENKWWYWIISKKGNVEFLGTICLWNFSEDWKTAEVGIELLPQYFNKGFASEALKKIIDFGFDDLELNTIEGFVQVYNQKSINLMKKNGFHFKSEFEEPSVIDSKPIKYAIYSLGKMEWDHLNLTKQ